MRAIALTYPVWFGLRSKTLRTSHPDKWEELTAPQMVALGRLMKGSISDEDLLIEMLNLSRSIIRKFDQYQRYKLGEILAFLQDRAPHDAFIIKEIAGLKAPADKLEDVTFGEFMHIDTFYMDYIESGEANDLLNLVSCIYVFHDKAGKRPLFNGHMDTFRVKMLTDAQQEAISINYGLIRTWLQKAYPEVFPTGNKATGDSKKMRGNGWVDVFDGLVGDDIVNADKYGNMPATEVLRFMNRKMVDKRKRKRKN